MKKPYSFRLSEELIEPLKQQDIDLAEVFEMIAVLLNRTLTAAKIKMMTASAPIKSQHKKTS